MGYKFTCRHCNSKFSLAQQLEDHEKACGKGGPIPDDALAKATGRARSCKYCGKPMASFAEYGKHRWEAHRDQVLAGLAKSHDQRKLDEKKIDAALAKPPGGEAQGQAPQAPRPSAPPPRTEGTTCPTCGGMLLGDVAALVDELRLLGFSEQAAFQATVAARRILAAVDRRLERGAADRKK